jgi:prepilin-type N-terminal cleavage/methylation domain-containing protein
MIKNKISNRHVLARTGYKGRGFTLLEIVVSMLVLGGILTIMFSGFSISKDLFNQALFESEAAFIAEREMEYLKGELLGGMVIKKPISTKNKFQLKKPWTVSTSIEADQLVNCYKIHIKVEKQEQTFALESFIYSPTHEEQNES